MKSLVQFIQEKLIIKKNKATNYKYFPETKEELEKIIYKRIKEEGNEVDLNDIDVSQIKDMSYLFDETDFNGDISNWNISNVTNMCGMFFRCKIFNQDISSWHVSNVKNMSYMFYECESFNQDISKWDVHNVTSMSTMFYKCESFNKDIFKWDVHNVTNMKYMFYECKKFNQDISKWDVSKVKNKDNMFDNCPIEEKHKPNFK